MSENNNEVVSQVMLFEPQPNEVTAEQSYEEILERWEARAVLRNSPAPEPYESKCILAMIRARANGTYVAPPVEPVTQVDGSDLLAEIRRRAKANDNFDADNESRKRKLEEIADMLRG